MKWTLGKSFFNFVTDLSLEQLSTSIILKFLYEQFKILLTQELVSSYWFPFTKIIASSLFIFFQIIITQKKVNYL